jgi:hypothetical protein
MSAVTAAKIIFKAIAARKREIVLSSEAKFAVWLHNNFPLLFDRITLAFYRGRMAK